MTEAARTMLCGLLSAVRLSVPDEVAGAFAHHGSTLGADEVTLYLADAEQYVLVPVTPTADASDETLGIDTTLAGKCYRQLEQQESDDGRVVWVPLLDGLERLGVIKLTFPDTSVRVDDELLHAFAAVAAEVVLTKTAYGDLFTRLRRRGSMSLAGEIAWNLMPPLTFGTERLVISCMLAPAYDVGGDSFDYAVDDRTARVAIFDAMGHGLHAGLLATVAVAAYRHARRHDRTLMETVAEIDAAVAGHFPDEQFVTGALIELDLVTGRLLSHSAGHPFPLLLRDGRMLDAPDRSSGLPLGLGRLVEDACEPHEQMLEPGDRLLLFSDGVVEARDSEGRFFGTDRLAELITRETAAGHPAPETMRLLMHAILDHQHDVLQDDLTTVLVEWKSGGEHRITP